MGKSIPPVLASKQTVDPNGLIIKSFFSLVNEMELGVLFRAKRPVFMVFYRRIQRSGFAFPRCLFSFFYRLSMGLLARLFHRNFMRKVSCFVVFHKATLATESGALLPSVCPGRRTHGAKMDFAWLYRRAGHSVFRQHAACLAFCRQAPLFLFCEFQRVQKAFPLLYRGRTNLFAQKNSGYRFFCNRC